LVIFLALSSKLPAPNQNHFWLFSLSYFSHCWHIKFSDILLVVEKQATALIVRVGSKSVDMPFNGAGVYQKASGH
jgi:hypothetical protein